MTRRSRPATALTAPLAKLMRGSVAAATRFGSAFRASISDGLRQRGIPASASRGVATAGARTTPITSPPGTPATPRTAWAWRTSSGSGGSSSRRFFPKIANAKAMAVAVVVPTSIGRIVVVVDRRTPRASRARVSVPQPDPSPAAGPRPSGPIPAVPPGEPYAPRPPPAEPTVVSPVVSPFATPPAPAASPPLVPSPLEGSPGTWPPNAVGPPVGLRSPVEPGPPVLVPGSNALPGAGEAVGLAVDGVERGESTEPPDAPVAVGFGVGAIAGAGVAVGLGVGLGVGFGVAVGAGVGLGGAVIVTLPASI